MKRVVLTTTDSNVYGGASGYTYTFPRQPDGTTAIDVVVIGEGKNSKGRVFSLVLGIGKDKLEKGFWTNHHGHRGPENGGESGA
jgi:hypothetical protein